MAIKFEPIYYRKKTAEFGGENLGRTIPRKVKKVKGNFNFRAKGKNIKRKTGWKVVGKW